MRVASLLGLVCMACTGGGDLALEGPREVRVEDLGPVESVPRAIGPRGEPVEVAWSVRPGEVARIDDGRVVAVGPGTAEVVGEAGGDRVSWTLVVDPVIVLGFDDPPASVGVGEQVALDVEAEAGGQPVEVDALSWSVQPPGRASIDDRGTLTGEQPGTVWVTVSEGDSEAMLELRVEP